MLPYMLAEADTAGYPSLGLPFGQTVIFSKLAEINILSSHILTSADEPRDPLVASNPAAYSFNSLSLGLAEAKAYFYG